MKDEHRQSLGRSGENLAVEHLQKIGYRTIERNVRLRNGEIDLVAKDGDVLVFVEVKTRQGQRLGLPEEAVTARKQAKLRTLAAEYQQIHHLGDTPVRIDVVAINVGPDGQATRIEVIKNAVDG